MDKLTKVDLSRLVSQSTSLYNLCQTLFGYDNERIKSKIRGWIFEYNLDTSHWGYGKKNIKYHTIEKICKCGNSFKTKSGGKGARKFCSRKCANSNRKHTDETKVKISNSLKGNSNCIPWNKGKIFTPQFQTLQCDICGKNFEHPKWSIRHTCSDECDFENRRNQHKKAYKDGRNFVAGGTTKWHEIDTSKGKIKVQGSFEVRACRILDSWVSQGKIKDWEYTNDRVQYVWEDGSIHNYLLDFKIYDNDGEFYYVETKGFEREHDRKKWKTVEDLGYKLEVWWKKTLEKYENGLLV